MVTQRIAALGPFSRPKYPPPTPNPQPPSFSSWLVHSWGQGSSALSLAKTVSWNKSRGNHLLEIAEYLLSWDVTVVLRRLWPVRQSCCRPERYLSLMAERSLRFEAKNVVTSAAQYPLFSDLGPHLQGKPLLPLVKFLVRHYDLKVWVDEVVPLWHTFERLQSRMQGDSGPVGGELVDTRVLERRREKTKNH